MAYNPTNNDTFTQIFAPLQGIWQNANHQYECHKLSDEQWVKAGVLRVIEDLDEALLQSRGLAQYACESHQQVGESPAFILNLFDE